jgi:hypothetical protein
MLCSNCGAQINDKAAICVHCHTPVRGFGIPPFPPFKKSGFLFASTEITRPCALSLNEIDSRMCNLSNYQVFFDLTGRNILPNGFEYKLSANMGIWSYGETIYVSATQYGPSTQINIFSKCVFPQLISWGKNRRNIRQIARALDINY